MELESGQEVLASDLEQHQAALGVSGELTESESAGLVNNLDAQHVSSGDLEADAQYVNADLNELIDDDGQAGKLTKALKEQGEREYGTMEDESGKRKAAKSDLKRESIEEKKQLQKEEQKIEKRAVIRFLTLRGKSGAKIHRQLKQVYGEQAPSLRNVNFWRLQFLKGGRLRLRNAEKCGRRATATTQENIEAARAYVELNPHAKISEVGKEIGVSHGTAFRILHEHLKLQNFGGKWVAASLKLDSHCQLQTAPNGAESLTYTDFEPDAGAHSEQFVYTPGSGPRRLAGSSGVQRSTRAVLSASASASASRGIGRVTKQSVSVVTVHPRSRRVGGGGDYVKSEMDEVNAMVSNYFEMEDAQQTTAEGDADGDGDGEDATQRADDASGNVVVGMAPDGSLYVVAADGDGGDGGEQQDAAGGYVVQEAGGYVVEETNYISYPETTM